MLWLGGTLTALRQAADLTEASSENMPLVAYVAHLTQPSRDTPALDSMLLGAALAYAFTLTAALVFVSLYLLKYYPVFHHKVNPGKNISHQSTQTVESFQARASRAPP